MNGYITQATEMAKAQTIRARQWALKNPRKDMTDFYKDKGEAEIAYNIMTNLVVADEEATAHYWKG